VSRRAALLGPLVALALAGCVEEVTLAPPADTSPLAVGQSRDITLRFLRFDVQDFEQSLTLEQLRALPRRTLEETWLLDLDLEPFVNNALARVLATSPEEVQSWDPAARNLWRLLQMSADDANLEGTSFEELIGIGKAVGVPPSAVLADLVGAAPNEPLAPLSLASSVVLSNVIATHPNAMLRRGPVTAEAPDGLYPVAPGHLPVSLYDVVTGFTGLAERYGPALDPNDPDAPHHPGFIQAASGIDAVTSDFRMTVHASLDALPWKGVDLTGASLASVNSTPSQVATMFDFDDPSWLELHGLRDGLTITSLTMGIYEEATFLPAGDAREPLPTGNGVVWSTPPWELEHVLAELGLQRAASIPEHCTSYGPAGSADPPYVAVTACIDDTGWVTLDLDDAVVLSSPPPAPQYFWDMLGEVGQVRLHDGGLAEGEGDVSLTLENVPVGVSADSIVEQLKANVQNDPDALRALAGELNDTTVGDADFFYLVPQDPAAPGDYLYFVAPEDLQKDESGEPARPYAYAHPGFYADEALTQKVSSTALLDGDGLHEKVPVRVGDVLFVEDDVGSVFRVAALAKPSPHRLTLRVTRVR
jgi:DNA polymerase III psi subunit